MSPRVLNCGYVPLVDSAPLIIARELNFAADEGIELNLLRQPSWSALRDLLALGHLDAAHILSPMPIAMSLGLSGMVAQIDALMVLSVNGNVIGVSNDLAQRMQQKGWNGAFLDPIGTGDALQQVAKEQTLRVGVPFPYSMHRFLFEYWMKTRPNEPDARFEIITTPPPMMAKAIGNGELDLYCVGEPWGSVAVDAGTSTLILPGQAIWAFAPEKVLGARREWAEEHPELCGGLMRAVFRAAKWLDNKSNQALAGEILSRSEHLDLPDHAIDRALTGRIVTDGEGSSEEVTNFLSFYRNAATFPWRSQAAWMAVEIAKRHGVDQRLAVQTAESGFRTDLYRTHLATIGVDMPGASSKVEGAMRNQTAVASTRGHMILGPDQFFDGQVFDLADQE